MARRPLERMRMVLSRIFIITFGAIMFVSTSAWEDSVISGLLFLSGCVFVAIGVVCRVWCSLYIAGYKTQTLVTDGPYSLCRNPLYLFSFIGALGVALATETISIALVMILVFAWYYSLIIRKEESKLREIHGEKFEEYCRRTPAFFPNFAAYREEETYTVNVRLFRKNTMDAMWFLWIVGLLELVEKLHEIGILPTYWTLY